jgi:surface glycoprotein (TIGR04207 family)
MSDKRKKALSVFFSAIMVLSVVALGSVGFVGSAAADSPGASTSYELGNSAGVSPGETINLTAANTTNANGNTQYTAVKISGADVTDENITSIAVYNTTSETQLGSNTSSNVGEGDTNVSFGSAVSPDAGSAEYNYTVEIGLAGDGTLDNSTNFDISTQLYNATGTTFSPNPAGFTPSSNVGNVTVNNFEQFNKDDRTNFNLSVTTPTDSSQGVNESSISVALNSSGSGLNATNITVIDGGSINSNVANDNGTNTDFNNGNATYDIDVALPEEEQGGYTATLLGNVTDDGGNLIKRVSGGAENITYGSQGRTSVNMTPDSLQVAPDENKFANTDAASDSGASTDENATVNVTVVDRFGNGLNTSSSTNATVDFVGLASGTTVTNVSTSPTYAPPNEGTGTRTAPFQFNVSNSFAGDVDLTATDTDSSDTSVASGSATQTFVAPVNGVTLSTKRTALPADEETQMEYDS